MFRLLGFLIGSLTSVLIILLIVGMPKFQLSDGDASQERYDAAIEKLRTRQQEIESVTGKLTEDVARVTESVTNIDDSQQIENTIPQAATEPPVESTASTVGETDQDLAPVAIDTVGDMGREPSWYSFWNPFRSELAANGFVSQLEKVTGLDYRVVKVKTGVYEVAFAYFDDSERQSKLTQIAMATGLDLPDS